MKAVFRAPPALQEAWIRRLRWHYDLYNHLYAGGRLRRPLFLIGSSRSRLGEWNGLTRAITISEDHVLEHSWESVLGTLRHEMAHQYAEDLLGHAGSAPHDQVFQKACHILRADPAGSASRAKLSPLDGSPDERDRMLTRVKELLAMAGSPNEHEAATAMRLANKYLLKYNLDLAELDSPRNFTTDHLGKCSGRIQEYEYTLAHILEEHFFVRVIWVFSYDPLLDRPGRVLQVTGTPENLEIARYVHGYVMNLTDSLWHAHCLSGERRGGTRLQYLAGVLHGLSDKLDSHRVKLKQEHGLVWLGDPLLKDFFRYLNPRMRRLGGRGVLRGDDYEAGVQDGKEITIRRGVAGESRNRGRLLS